MPWSEGYVTEVGYTHGYYRELAPLMMELALTYKLQAVRRERPLRYLELGFGQGLSLNIHAAAMNGEFWGNDFNPAQAAHAAELAKVCGSGARILDDSFAELAARPDLPEFDIIALHGIWSWVSDENRAIIVDIIRRKLVPGGIVMMSYNALPGWAGFMPVRDLMLQHTNLAEKATTALPGRIRGAIDFADKLGDMGALFFKAQPGSKDWLKTLTGWDAPYLAHEYFNADWHPMAFADVARQLEEAKVTYAAPGALHDHYDVVNLVGEQPAFVAGISDPILRESTRDFFLNRQFRCDIWVKGARQITPAQQTKIAKPMRVVLTACPSDIPLVIKGRQLVAKLSPELYNPLLETFASDSYAPKSIGDLMAKHPALDLRTLLEAIILLAGGGHLSPAQDDAEVQKAISKTGALNLHLLQLAADRLTSPAFLASPVTGGGITVPGLEPAFLHALKSGAKAPEDWAAATWGRMAALGRRVIKDGKSLQTAEENLDELKRQAHTFAATRLPLLRALMVA
jgi:SAM-dependent methyltransferase